MNMRKEIRHAFDHVHAPEELVERMKQELYQKDFHEEVEEVTCEVSEAPRRPVWRYVMYTAASLALCIGCGLSVWSLRDSQNPMNPGSHVGTTTSTSTTEETTETTEAPEDAYNAENDMLAQEKLNHAESRQLEITQTMTETK